MTVDFDNAGSTVMRPSSFAHVFLKTNKFKEMVAFYKNLLDAEARFQSERIAFMCFDEEHHRIAIAAVPHTTDKVRTSAGLEHIAFGFNSIEDLLLAYRQRKNQGLVPMWCVNHGITLSIYYEDPDGNRLETQVDAYDTVDAATDFMNSQEFKNNPIGVDFDPEDLIKRLQNGESAASVMKRDENGVKSIPP